MWYESKRSLNSSAFKDWAPHQPDNHHGQENCVYLVGTGHWADGACHTALHYVCEKPDEYVKRCVLSFLPPFFMIQILYVLMAYE